MKAITISIRVKTILIAIVQVVFFSLSASANMGNGVLYQPSGSVFIYIPSIATKPFKVSYKAGTATANVATKVAGTSRYLPDSSGASFDGGTEVTFRSLQLKIFIPETLVRNSNVAIKDMKMEIVDVNGKQLLGMILKEKEVGVLVNYGKIPAPYPY